MIKPSTLQPLSIKRAAAIQLISKYGTIAIQLLITAILARILTPDDFGTIAIVTVFIAFFQMFSDMGIGAAIIQYRDLSEKNYGELFGFSIVVAITLAGLFCLASIPISLFYNSTILVPLCCFASVTLIFSTLNMVPNGLMLKDKLFLSIGIRLIASTAIAGIAAIALSFLGMGLYALIAQSAISSGIVLAWNILRRPIRYISFRFGKVLKKVFSYSAYQLGFGIINYFSRNLDNLVIGKALEADALGFYDKAYKLTTYPMTAFSSVIASIIQPFMAEHQNNLKIIYDYWFSISKLISLVAAPIAAIFFCASNEIVLLMYGEQWGEAVPILHALSFSVYFQMLGNPTGAFFQSCGRTDLMFRLGLINTAITVTALLIGLSTGNLITISLCISIGLSLGIIPCAVLLVHTALKQKLSCLVKFIPEIVLFIIICFTISLTSSLFPNQAVLTLLIKAGIIMLLFIIGYAASNQIRYFDPLLKRKKPNPKQH